MFPPLCLSSEGMQLLLGVGLEAQQGVGRALPLLLLKICLLYKH